MKYCGLLFIVGLAVVSSLEAPKYSILTDFQLQQVLASCIVSCSQDDVLTIRVPAFCEGMMSVAKWLSSADKQSANLMVERELNPAILTSHTYELARSYAQTKIALKGDSSLTDATFWSANNLWGLRCDELDIYILRFAHDEKDKECPERPVLGWYRLNPQNFSEDAFSAIRRQALAPFILHQYPLSKLTTDELNALVPFAKFSKKAGEILILRATWEEGEVPLYLWHSLPPYAKYAWFKLDHSKIESGVLDKLTAQLAAQQEKGVEFVARRRSASSQNRPATPRGRLQAAADYVATTKSVVDAFSTGLQGAPKHAPLPTIVRKTSSANAS